METSVENGKISMPVQMQDLTKCNWTEVWCKATQAYVDKKNMNIDYSYAVLRKNNFWLNHIWCIMYIKL